jgi:hypothetical protein
MATDRGIFASARYDAQMLGLVPQVNVTGAANNGSGLVRLTVSSTADMATGQSWFVNSAGGNPGSVNLAEWTITVVDSTHIDLQGPTFFGCLYVGRVSPVSGND